MLSTPPPRCTPQPRAGFAAAHTGGVRQPASGAPSARFSPQAPWASHARRCATPHAVKKTFTSFEAMIAESDVPVLVDFYAVWRVYLQPRRLSDSQSR
jgi:hypothetical protein